ncbi:protein lin-9 homolog isoform X1 [Octopus sinensis]|uniref:Protein lin-9 homolog isoform X1 n=1 Tax=Octopus sinensis TaxID=2607531 RepID=A0A7E6FP73_9MOLL|nr:protein lin-9 homolog isoform X1 [Octopus sinensis]
MAEESLESSSAKALVSLKEGKGCYRTPPRRGNPQRIRKKNSRFYNEEEESGYCIKTPKKQAKTPTSNLSTSCGHEFKTQLPSSIKYNRLSSSPDKKKAYAIGIPLRNLLKLPKAHRWVCYEWFYSNLDMPLFQGENEFCSCLRESFPQLKTKLLRRVEWCKIRRLMGKPRRCSAAFFKEERDALDQRRCKIRLLQQRKLRELTNFKDLPEEIPMHLVIGTKVTARFRKVQDGLFTGSVEALDTVNNTYRVIFDRAGLGTHSISDYEVLSTSPQETTPLSAFQQRHRSKLTTSHPPRFAPRIGSPSHQLENDPLLSSSPIKTQFRSLEGATYGGFPVKFLLHVIKLSKILLMKKDWIKKLKEMNCHAEKFESLQKPITYEFQRKYAGVVLELERLNKELQKYLNSVQHFCQEIVPEQGLPAIDQPSEIKQRCEDEAQRMVEKVRLTSFINAKTAKNEQMMKLIINLTSLMLQVKTFAENDFNSFEFCSLQDSLDDIKKSLDGNNINSFQNNVEIHINHIQSGLSQMGNLHAFSTTASFTTPTTPDYNPCNL